MIGRTFETVKFIVQSISVILSVLINTLLIYLIITKSPKKVGTYRHLMIYFCCFSIFFSTMDIIVQPTISTYKSSFYMAMDYHNRGINKQLAIVLICIMCGCFGATICGIAIHFIYRYFALERQGRLRYFKEKFLILWFLVPITGGTVWFLICAVGLPMDSVKSEYIREAIEELFGMEIEHTVYVGAVFYPFDEQGVVEINWRSFICFGSFMVVMAIPFNVVVVVGFKSWKKIRGLVKQGDSKYTRNLQMQLYKALVAQTVIPICLLFIPFGFIFTCPIFEIDCQFMSAPITFVYAFYPAVDPLPIIYFVDSYRNAVSGFFSRWYCKKNQIGITDVEEEASRSQPIV